MIVITILSVVILLFIMTVASLGELGVSSPRRKVLYTLLGGLFILKNNFSFVSNYKRFKSVFKIRNKGLSLIIKSLVHTLLLPLDFKRSIETISVVSVVMEETYISSSKHAGSLSTSKREAQQIKGFLEHFNNDYR